MTNDNLAFASVSELRQLIDSRQVSIPELTELFLRRIESLDPRLNAYLTVIGDEAMASAAASQEALEKDDTKGPLHGIPVSIKDLDITKGVRTTMGSLVFKDYIPDEDSAPVERVRASGAIILGKTNTPEFGLIGTTENRLGDPCRNPWNVERTPGGSSGGSASAVAAGLCTIATGSDGGGSVRIPCGFTGIFGIKPGQGRVPRYGGVVRLAHNFISQVGPMTRTVRDSAVLLQVLAGPDSRDPSCMREQPPDFVGALDQGVRGLRMAWSSDLGYAAVDPEVAEVAGKAARVFEELGCGVDEPGISMDNPVPVFEDVFAIMAYTSYEHLLQDHRDELTDYCLGRIEQGGRLSAGDYSRRLAQVIQLQARFEDLFDRYDLILTPTLATTAFPPSQNPTVIGGRQVDPFWGYTPFSSVINMTMNTAASVPCGFSEDGLPIGLHVIGRRGNEAMVLRAAASFEQARPWADKRPPVS